MTDERNREQAREEIARAAEERRREIERSREDRPGDSGAEPFNPVEGVPPRGTTIPPNNKD